MHRGIVIIRGIKFSNFSKKYLNY